MVLIRTLLLVPIIVAGLIAQSATAARAAPPEGPPTPPAPQPAHKPTRGEGIVLAVLNDEILVDMGTNDGLAPEMTGMLFTRVKLVHPISGLAVEDLVPLARVKVKQAGVLVSATVIADELLIRVRPGDAVRFDGLTPPLPPPSASCPECPECEQDEDASRVHAAWQAAAGTSLELREVIWKTLLDQNPGNRYKGEILQEIDRLAAFRRELRVAADAAAEATKRKAARPVSYHVAAEKVPEGAVVTPIVFLHSREGIAVARLYVRHYGDREYQALVMQPCGDAHFQATVPADLVTPPGLEYYIDAQDGLGRRIAAHASGDSPTYVAVSAPVQAAPDARGRSSAQFNVEWTDFFLESAGRDYYWRAEGDFAYRLRFGFFYSFRMGFGIFEGAGGPAEDLEQADSIPAVYGAAPESERLSFTYSYFEPEFALGPYVHLMPRLVIGGIREKGLPGEEDLHRGESIFGAHAYLRIGKEEGTNLLLGGSLTQDMGIEALVTMSLAVFEHFPVGVSVAATNLPVAEDYAARMALKVGWRQLDWMSIDALLGLNMRNIRHIGMGTGLGLTFNW
jgi:hypothetical protein